MRCAKNIRFGQPSKSSLGDGLAKIPKQLAQSSIRPSDGITIWFKHVAQDLCRCSHVGRSIVDLRQLAQLFSPPDRWIVLLGDIDA